MSKLIRYFEQPIAAMEPRRSHQRFLLSILCAPILVLLSDWLFYKQQAGLTIPLFFAGLGAAVFLTRRKQASESNQNGHAFLLLLFAFLPGIEHLSFLSVLFGLIGLASFTFMVNQAGRNDALSWSAALFHFTWRALGRLLRDLWHLTRAFMRQPSGRDPYSILRMGLIPVLFTGLFLVIFQQANPILDQWMREFDLDKLIQLAPNRGRIYFWLLTVTFAWAFLRLSRPLYGAKNKGRGSTEDHSYALGLLHSYSHNEKSVLLSLILFNGMFALQSLTDLHLFSTGLQLPAGYNFADFAHQGAYALIVATLLAAGFILAFGGERPGKTRPFFIKALLYLWVGQNMLLVGFAMLRLHLYIDAYSLTYLRVWSLIWMGLVFVGLLLILIKLHRNRSSRWLINANIIVTVAVLYGAAFVNFPLIIARHNFEASQSNPAKKLDLTYLVELGEDALQVQQQVLNVPRYADFLQKNIWFENEGLSYLLWVSRFKDNIRESQSDWRQWNFRHARLKAWIDQVENDDNF